jgi:hypothetical protein
MIKVIEIRGLLVLIETIAVLTGSIPHKMWGFFPTSYGTYMNCVYALKKNRRIFVRKNRNTGEKYLIPTNELLEEYKNIVQLSPLKDKISAHLWSMRGEESTALQIALLSEVKINGVLRILYEPGTRGHHNEYGNSGIKAPAYRIREVKDCLSNEDILIGDYIIEEVALFGLGLYEHFGLFLTKSKFINMMKRGEKLSPYGIKKQWKYTRCAGWFIEGTQMMRALYIIEDLKKFKLNVNTEKGIRMNVFEKKFKSELGAVFIVNTPEEKEMLLKNRHTHKDREIYPNIFRPSSIFDTFDVFTFAEARAIQTITGCFWNFRED